MIATIAMLALVAQAQTPSATKFSHKFVKDETTLYTVDISGSTLEGEVKLALEFELKTKETSAEGSTPCSIHVTRARATFGGQEMPFDEAGDLDLVLNKFGVPKTLDLAGFESVYYFVFMMRYLPDKELKPKETFKGELDLETTKLNLEGSYLGDEELDGKKYAVLSWSGSLSNAEEAPGEFSSKSFYDSAAGKIDRTEASLKTQEDDEFHMVVQAKKA